MLDVFRQMTTRTRGIHDGAPASVIVLAGPNGAGKSTAAPFLLGDTLRVVEFVNADTIAQGLAAFDPDSVSLEAGRILRARLRNWPPGGVISLSRPPSPVDRWHPGSRT